MKYETGTFTIGEQKKPNTEIWIADNVVINCRAKYNWFNKLMLKVILNWEVKKIK